MKYISISLKLIKSIVHNEQKYQSISFQWIRIKFTFCVMMSTASFYPCTTIVHNMYHLYLQCIFSFIQFSFIIVISITILHRQVCNRCHESMRSDAARRSAVHLIFQFTCGLESHQASHVTGASFARHAGHDTFYVYFSRDI